MTITAFSFLVFLLLGAVLYYILPKAWQWVVLLILSVIFYVAAAEPYTLIYLILSTALAYGATMLQSHASPKIPARLVSAVGVVAIVLNLGIWFVLKGSEIWEKTFNVLGRFIPTFAKIPESYEALGCVAALGMGYYTLQVIGYILDCYWGNVEPQKNPLKLFLFVCFFPQLTTGPISRYNQLSQIYEKHRFSYENMCFGAQRILWGFFKKLVLAERVAIIVSGVWENLEIYTGYWRWIAMLLYPIELYADFSGCMDIVLGAAEIFGIRMPENFNSPFFSRTIQEFWQRWHITLGAWAKDYVLYPLLKSSKMVKFSKFCKKRFGKKMGKFISTAVGMFVLWMAIGIWHGAFRHIVGVSLWFWLLLMLGELFAPFFKKINTFLKVPENSFCWRLFQSARTYIIFAVGVVFFRAPYTSTGIQFIKSLTAVDNPWVIFDGSVLELGVTYQDLNLIILAVVLLIIVGVLREKFGYARTWVAKQFLPFRWLIWLGLFAVVLIYGKYGPGFDAAEFIYQGF